MKRTAKAGCRSPNKPRRRRATFPPLAKGGLGGVKGPHSQVIRSTRHLFDRSEKEIRQRPVSAETPVAH